MAKTDAAAEPSGPPAQSEADKNKARKWFARALECGKRHDYDYGVECFIMGLAFWPEAVEEGHMPLRALALARLQAGGKKAGMMEGLKRSMGTKDARQAMLNAEFLLSKDPANAGYVDGFLKAAEKAHAHQTLKWAASMAAESLRKDKKPNKARFRAFRDVMQSAAERAAEQGNHQLAAWFYEQAVNSLDVLIARDPGDMALKSEQRDLSGKLAINKGKYSDAESFRESLQDADAQKLLHDTERVKQGDQTVDALIEAARAELAAHLGEPAKVNALVDALLRRERKEEEDEAVALLEQAFAQSRNYSFKARADDIRIKQLNREARELLVRARESGADADRQAARQGARKVLDAELGTYRERVDKYPTDLRLRYRLGAVLFRAGEFDEAIPVLQAAQADPRSRVRAQLLIGRCFLEKQNPTQAREVLAEALGKYELTDDVSKELTYWLARSYEADGAVAEAKDAYGRLLRQDYNYGNGEARQRLEALK